MAQLQYSLSAAEEANNANAEDGEAISPLASPKKGKGGGGADAAKGGADPDAAARQALERTRTRWKKVWKTQVNCKAAVQHILDAVETVRLARDGRGSPTARAPAAPPLAPPPRRRSTHVPLPHPQVRVEDEVVAPLTDETLLEHLLLVERKLQRCAPPAQFSARNSRRAILGATLLCAIL